jgi:hypothetical protein
MSFWYALPNGDGTVNVASAVKLWPAPTDTDYPPRFEYTVLETDAGNGVRQRSKRQAKEHAWVWKDYGYTAVRYEDQYWQLFNLSADRRIEQGLQPFIYLKEEVTLNFGKFDTVTARIEPAWVRCVVTYVGRTAAKGGGRVRYDETVLRFLISDPTITMVL